MKLLRTLPLPRGLRRPSRGLRRLGVFVLVALVLLLVSPYVSLWRLDELVRGQPPEALAGLVDIDGVRSQILRRLNKDEHSSIGMVSDPFIEWIEKGLRTPGNEALRQTVSLEWLHALLAAKGSGDRGFLPAVGYAFYAPPNGFLVRIDDPGQASLYLRMELRLFGWRVTAAYY